MTAPLSNDLRLRVVKAIDGGLSRRAAADKYDVSIASAVRWYQRYRETGSVHPKPIGGDRYTHLIEIHADKIVNWIDVQRDLTLTEIRGWLASEGATLLAFRHLAAVEAARLHSQKRPRMPMNRNERM